MCVNYETSLISFIIGEMSGLSLILLSYFDSETESIEYEKMFIGLFIMFYTLIQFCELKIYQTNNSDIISQKLLILNLEFQGLLFFILMSLIYKIHGIYIMICGLVSVIIILEVIFDSNLQDIELSIDHCLKWNFMKNNKISLSLAAMYLTMFFWVFVEPNSYFIKYVGFILLFTLIFSYIIFNNIIININSPSIWCLSSAIAAPLFILY
jgi:hypothetical protein